MWVMVMFDLPVTTVAARRAYSRFHKDLLKDGFSMWQYSIYLRHCASEENGTVHVQRIERKLPKAGKVSILTITEKQMANIHTFWGKARQEPDDAPMQLEMF